MPRCLVTGASGFIGRHLVPELSARGYQVRCLVRPSSDVSPFVGLPIELAYGDLIDGRGLEGAVEGVDSVFHLGGLIRARRRGDYRAVNAEGTGHLLEACVRGGRQLHRFVLVSSLAAAGPSVDGSRITEESPSSPSSEYGRSKRAGEVAALLYGDRLPITITRGSP